MAVDVVSVQGKKAIGGHIDLAHKAVLDPLAHHRALLARDREHVGFDVRRDVLAKSHIKVLPRPFGAAALRVAYLEIIDAERSREIIRGRDQRSRRLGIVRSRAAVDGKWKRHERMSEQATANDGERHDTRPSSIALGNQIMTAMAKDFFDDLAPADPMKERRIAAP